MLDSYKQKQAEVESLQQVEERRKEFRSRDEISGSQDFNRMRSQTFQLEKNVELLSEQQEC